MYCKLVNEDYQIFQVWPYWNLLIKKKFKIISKFFPLPLPNEIWALPFDFVLGQKNIFNYQLGDLENYMDQVLNFLIFEYFDILIFLGL